MAPTLIDRLAVHARDRPDSAAFLMPEGTVSFAELQRAVAGRIGILVDAGVGVGDRILIACSDPVSYTSWYYASWGVGGIAVGVNPDSRLRTLLSVARHAGVAFIVIDPTHPDAAALQNEADACEIPSAPSDISTTHGTAVGQGVAERSAPACILYTSGTTGAPKGVVLTHANLVANATAIASYLGLSAQDRTLTPLPLHYSYGASVLHSHVHVGGTLCIAGSAAFGNVLMDLVDRFAATGFAAVPTTLQAILGPLRKRRSPPAELRYVTQAGAHANQALFAELASLLPRTRLYAMYGQTECTARISYLPPEDIQRKPGSVGIPIEGLTLEIRDDQGTPVGPKEEGTVWVTGTSVMQGYWHDEESTARVLQNGWLDTGDRGYLDADGYLYLVGRQSEMLKSGAHRISPLEIEDVLYGVPGIAEAAVCGVPDDRLGERVAAALCVDDEHLDDRTILAHCRDHLPTYKLPRLLKRVSALPKGATGKILRGEVRKLFENSTNE